jgi:hypothetical protein
MPPRPLSHSRNSKRASAIVEMIKPMLADQRPDIQSAVLADLLAIWLAGHAPQVREEVLAIHLKLMRPMIAVNERMIFGEQGHPGSRS